MSFRYFPALALLLLLLPATHAQTFVDVIDPVGNAALWGLHWSDGALYAANTSDDQIVRIDTATGAVTVEANLSFDPRGVTWDGLNWRVSTGFDSSDPRIFTIAPDGTELGSIPAPSALTHGLTLFDGDLYAAKAYPNPEASIVALDPATGAPQDTIAFPETQPGGIAFTGPGTFWATNVGDDGSNIERLYEIEAATGDVIQTLDLPDGVGRPRGLATDGAGLLYLVAREGIPVQYRIYVIDLASSGNPALGLSASMLDFGPRVFGASYDLPLTLFNTGDGPLEISNVAITGPDAGVFSTTLTDVTINPGNLAVTVTFSPDAFGPREAALTFDTNDITQPSVSIPLTGTGIYAEQHVGFVEDSHAFGPVRIDPPEPAHSSVRWTLQIVNEGDDPLTVTGITFDDDAFRVLRTDFPLLLGTLDTAAVEIEFRPTEVRAYSATATVASDDAGNPAAEVMLTGEGINPALDPGTPLWTLATPDNPNTSFDDGKVHSMKVPGDLTGDGLDDLIIASRNYLTYAVDANGWGTPAVLWSFNTCPNNNNCGAVSGNSQLFEYGMDAGHDLNGDGVGDVVIGTEGGNDHVYALSGVDGSVIWEVGSDTDPFLASYYSVSARRDVDGDGIPEVATGTGSADLANSPDPFNHRKVYLLNGADGAILWERSTGLPNFRTVLFGPDASIGTPSVAAGGGESGTNVLTAWQADTGQQLWSIQPSYTPFLIEPLEINLAGQEDLIAAGLGTLIQRINGLDGSVVWTANANGTSVWDVAMIRGTAPVPHIAVGSTGSDVRLLDGATGDQIWEYNLGDQVFDVDAVPDADGDNIDDVAATGKSGQTVLLSGADGTLLWSYTFGDGSFDESGEVVRAVPDLDGNGVPEVAFGTRDGRSFLLFGGGGTIPVGTEGGETPTRFALDPAYPNPFNPSTTLRYHLPETATARLAAFDVLGRKVWEHVAEEQPAGRYTVSFDARDLASGLYLVRLDAGGVTQTQAVTLVK